MGGLRSPHLQYSLIHSVVSLGRGSSQISDLHLQSPISQRRHLRPDSVRSPISISNLQSPISNLDSGARGRRGAQTFKEMQFGFIHTDHLSSPISNLLLGHCRAAGSNLRPPFSIFDLTSGADGWALGSTIYTLHLLSPHFGAVLLLSDLQSTISIFEIFSLEKMGNRTGGIYWRDLGVSV